MKEIEGVKYYEEEEIKKAFADANAEELENIVKKDGMIAILGLGLFAGLANNFFKRLFNKTMKEVADESEREFKEFKDEQSRQTD